VHELYDGNDKKDDVDNETNCCGGIARIDVDFPNAIGKKEETGKEKKSSVSVAYIFTIP